MVQTIGTKLPAIAVLENVGGVSRYFAQIWKHIRRLGWYEVVTCRIDPADMGEPIARPRIFFLLARVDIVRHRGEALDEFVAKLLAVGCRSQRVSLASRVLPNSSAIVVS